MNDVQKIALSEGLEAAPGFRMIKILPTTLAQSGRRAMHACGP
jgi:hypothetical protein